MIRFSVVKETHGWSVRMGERMTTPFWSKDRAVWEANRLADAIRRHGARTEVIIETGPGDLAGDLGGAFEAAMAAVPAHAAHEAA